MGIGKLGIIQKQLKVEVNQNAHRICAKTGDSFVRFENIATTCQFDYK